MVLDDAFGEVIEFKNSYIFTNIIYDSCLLNSLLHNSIWIFCRIGDQEKEGALATSQISSYSTYSLSEDLLILTDQMTIDDIHSARVVDCSIILYFLN